MPSVTEDIIPVSEQGNMGEEVSFQRRAAMPQKTDRAACPGKGDQDELSHCGWTPTAGTTGTFSHHHVKIRQWRDGPCYSCLLQEKKRRRLVTKVKIAELQSSFDSKAALTPLQSLSTGSSSHTLRWSVARRRGWQTQKCACFFSDSSFCTVSLLQVSGMLHPILGTWWPLSHVWHLSCFCMSPGSRWRRGWGHCPCQLFVLGGIPLSPNCKDGS